ncbi:metallophosphoesterase domain containing 1 [Cricetulus griseus]
MERVPGHREEATHAPARVAYRSARLRRWDPGILKAEALALLPCGLGMAFSQSHVMAARRHQHGRLIIEVDEYSSNPTQAFTFYNINQGRFQPPHVQMVDPVPHDAPKPPGYTRFVCVSDTHSRTDPIQMPYGDVLIHAGDFTELGLPSEVKKFNEWLGSLPYEYKIVIAGNHELTFDQEFMADLIKQDFYYFPSVSKLKPENYENVQALLTNCIYLQDSEVTVRGFRIYGSPCNENDSDDNGYGDVGADDDQAMEKKEQSMEMGLMVMMVAAEVIGIVILAVMIVMVALMRNDDEGYGAEDDGGGFLDWVPKKMQRVGCVELLNTVQRRVQPRLHVFGHIHEGYGVMADGTTTYVNASVCTVNYQPVNPPIVIDLPTPRNS